MELLPVRSFSVVVPPGTYVLGDPCYTVAVDDWQVLLESCDYFNTPIGEVKGHKILGFSTMYGDGVYRGSDGKHYPVDAGLIGLVPYDYAASTVRDNRKIVQLVKLDYPTLCTRSQEGMLTFGGIKIDTENNDIDDEGND
jgi:hypothetical protein